MFYVATLPRACAILPGRSCPKEKFRETRAWESFHMGRSTGAERPIPGKSCPREKFRETSAQDCFTNGQVDSGRKVHARDAPECCACAAERTHTHERQACHMGNSIADRSWSSRRSLQASKRRDGDWLGITRALLSRSFSATQIASSTIGTVAGAVGSDNKCDVVRWRGSGEKPAFCTSAEGAQEPATAAVLSCRVLRVFLSLQRSKTSVSTLLSLGFRVRCILQRQYEEASVVSLTLGFTVWQGTW